MRKKSKKKQIVAMTLALSVLSSSVGMCGAAAATDPPPPRMLMALICR